MSASNPDSIQGIAAVCWVGGLGLALLVTAAGFALVRRSLRRQAAAERGSLAVDPLALREGAVALAGTVETMDGDGDRPPITVEPGVGCLEARPFLLRLANGLRVQVEPGERPLLRDALEGSVATLSPGEIVYVRGALAVGSGEVRAVLHPPRWRRLVLSTEGFSGELEKRADALGFQWGLLVSTLVVTQVLYLELYIDWFTGKEPPQLFIPTFFWVALGVFSMILGSLWSAWEERPWHTR